MKIKNKITVFLGILFLISCEKEYTCECKTGIIAISETITATKKEAEEKCNEGDITLGGSTITDCELR